MPLKFCRVCTAAALSPLWKDDWGFHWSACSACGSQSSDAPYPAALYQRGYVAQEVAGTGGPEKREQEVLSNVDWFPHYQHLTTGRDFLDIGCCDGAAMRVAERFGYSVHGFDVTEDARQPGCTTIYPYFAASLFPRLFHFVLCREVLEHVPGWRGFLSELTAATERGGVVQIQTPRPVPELARYTHQLAHLQIVSPAVLERTVKELGYKVLDKREWPATETGPAGQAVLLHLADKPG